MLISDLVNKLVVNNTVALVGPTNSGKTYWVKNILIPHLESLGKKVEYLKDGDMLPEFQDSIVISDEAETMFDAKYLQGNKVDDYYAKEYLEKVDGWYKNYTKLPSSTLFIITRNSVDQIENLVKNFHTADWDGRNIFTIRFNK